ncbi:MAG: DUF4129 domain-containing protein, partial [Halobacteriaceae archaeon]
PAVVYTDPEIATVGMTEEEAEEETDQTALAEIGRAAGAAADRIVASGEAENEVYRAWMEMTDLLDLSEPETKTPGEFASAAREAGMNPDDVDELTQLFEEVRYGGLPATDEAEERAIKCLRRIEEGYS